jgi:hypothetical protein
MWPFVVAMAMLSQPACEPPCSMWRYSTDDQEFCYCPEDPIAFDGHGKAIDPRTLDLDYDGTQHGGMTLEIDSDEDAEIEWEVKQLGDWLCVRQPKREEK